MKKMDPGINFLTRKRPSLIGNLLRNKSTGCLLYVGRQIGRVQGNPVVGVWINGRKTTMHLRSWVWSLYRSPNETPFVELLCKTQNCVEHRHMRQSRKMRKYYNTDHLPQSRMSDEIILTIRYFLREKVPVAILSRVFTRSGFIIRNIGRVGVRPDLKLRRDFVPSADIMNRVAQESIQSSHFYLPPDQKAEAIKAISASPISSRKKKLLLERIKGKYLNTIVREIGLTRDRVIKISWQALFELHNLYGYPDWLKIISHNRLPSRKR
jgi:hypothetical protein